MVDETTDICAGIVLCLRWVAALNVHEEFVGLYKVHSISSDSLVAVITLGEHAQRGLLVVSPVLAVCVFECCHP